MVRMMDEKKKWAHYLVSDLGILPEVESSGSRRKVSILDFQSRAEREERP